MAARVRARTMRGSSCGLDVAGLHPVSAVLDGDLGEGDAGGGGVAGGEHAGEVQGGVAVLEVELVHSGGELVAVAGLFEEGGLHVVVGDEVAEGDADEEGLLVLGGVGGVFPAALEGFEEGEGVLTGAGSGLPWPSRFG